MNRKNVSSDYVTDGWCCIRMRVRVVFFCVFHSSLHFKRCKSTVNIYIGRNDRELNECKTNVRKCVYKKERRGKLKKMYIEIKAESLNMATAEVDWIFTEICWSHTFLTCKFWLSSLHVLRCPHFGHLVRFHDPIQHHALPDRDSYPDVVALGCGAMNLSSVIHRQVVYYLKECLHWYWQNFLERFNWHTAATAFAMTARAFTMIAGGIFFT